MCVYGVWRLKAQQKSYGSWKLERHQVERPFHSTRCSGVLPLEEAHTPCPGVRTTRLEDSVWSSKASRNTKNFPSIASQFLENWTRVTATMNPRWDWILLALTGRRQLEPLEQNQLMRMLPSRHTAKLKYRSISGIMIGFACSE